MNTLNVRKLHNDAKMPVRAHPHDAGLDLYALENVSYKPGDCLIVKTGIAVEIEPGYVGLIRDKSSIGAKRLKVTAGVVDAGYNGDVSVVLINHSGTFGCIEKGAKVAQLLVLPIALPEVREVRESWGSARGANGFGSSGAV